MRTKVDRRKFLLGTGALGAASTLAKPALAQQKPIKDGLMTVKTGGLAAGGIHLEEGIPASSRTRTSRWPVARLN
jgi:branched-chain amino acid transport system substrate-binding protein